MVVLYGDAGVQHASVCGPIGDDPACVQGLELRQAEQIAAAALLEPDRHSAIRFLLVALPEAHSDLPGIRNSGMFASHELRTIPGRPDWPLASANAVGYAGLRGRVLVQALGFTVERRSPTTEVLRAKGVARAVAIFLDDHENIEGTSTRFGGTSPITHAIAAADAEGIPYVLVTRGPQLRVYSAEGIGVGRKGRTETFIEAHLTLLPASRSGYLKLLFSAEALAPGGTFEDILERSRDFSSELGKRLRVRIYEQVVPALARAVAHRTPRARKPVDDKWLEHLYEVALVVVFRLLFIAYGEDKDLLPYRTNGLYQRHALKTLARELADARNKGPLHFDAQAKDRWADIQSLFRAVNEGNREWGVPAYGGGLFSTDEDDSPVGSTIEELVLTNDDIGPALLGLLVDGTDEGTFGPVDFRSLSVREFGTIYEGLLESSLSIAGTPLTVDASGRYVPAGAGQQVEVPAGDIYLHNQSGVRKSTGSYFTKPFAVEHLLRQALDPILDAHVARIRRIRESTGEAEASAAFFDLKCADIAMGSGHFLVAAVDHIEAKLSSLLAEAPLPAVSGELERLRAAAIESLGALAGGVEIEDSALLRRQVARRCIYGVDKNQIAVELARLAIWVHTFLPGLPLSFLDHNLVRGDSLVGISTLDEAANLLDPAERGRPSLFRDVINSWLEPAADKLRRLARATEATTAEVRASRQAHIEARNALLVPTAIFDLLIASRLGEATVPTDTRDELVLSHPGLPRAQQLASELGSLHIPIAFPEVFQRPTPGFDCVVGNPPWDKVRFEEQQFWVGREPGLNALRETQREVAIKRLRRERPAEAEVETRDQIQRERLQRYFLTAFEDQGTGHLEYAKLFVERALRLLSKHGCLAYVLPRQALVLGGWKELRRLLIRSRRVTLAQARNKGGWLFDDLHHSYMVALAMSAPALKTDAGVAVWPDVANPERLLAAASAEAIWLTQQDLDDLTDSCVIPWFASSQDRRIFDALRSQPRLDAGSGWITGSSDARWDFSGSGRHREFASTDATPGAWHVLMARHVDPYVIDQSARFERYIPRPAALVSLNLGVVRANGSVALGSDHPFIVFRYPSRNDDARTLIAAALGVAGELYSTGYVHGLKHKPGTSFVDLLALLGYLNSFTCDWWVRRFADRHVTAPVLNRIPLPAWKETDRARVAAIVAQLLQRGGAGVLAGGVDLTKAGKWSEVTPASEAHGDLRIAIEHEVVGGFGLGKAELALILQDFSAKGCPPAMRTALLQ